jgi:hypothetical protein
MEHLKGALRFALLLLAFIRLGWKCLPAKKQTLFLFGLFVSYKEKSLKKFAPGVNHIKPFYVIASCS